MVDVLAVHNISDAVALHHILLVVLAVVLTVVVMRLVMR